jgi:hypothetical protein
MTPVTKRKNSRAKGARGERAFARKFEEWWGTDFTRTPSSGGFATAKFRDDWNAAGDLVTPDPAFPFCVECKWVEGWTLEQLFNPGCIIYSWWEQTKKETPDGKIPLLVFKKNSSPMYVMIRDHELVQTPRRPPEQGVGEDAPIFTFDRPNGAHTEVLNILLLDDFFRVGPQHWRKV